MADDSKHRAFRSESSGLDASTMENSPGGSPKDPLAELARLIGQDDLFDQMRRDASRTGKPSQAAESGVAKPAAPEMERTQELRGSYDAQATEPAVPMLQPTHHGEPRQMDAHHGEPRHIEPRHIEPRHVEPRYAEPAADYRREDITPMRRATPVPGMAYDHREPAPQHDLRNDEAAGERGYAEHEDGSQGHYAKGQDPQGQYAEQHEPQYADGYDPAYDPANAYDESPYAEDAVPEKRRGGMMTIAAVLGIAVIGTAGAFGYRALSGAGGDGQPPVIKANSAPAKVAAAPANRDASGRPGFDRNDRSQPERVVSREETPMEIKEARASAPRSMPASAGPGMVGAAGPTVASFAASAPTAAFANSNEPKKVKTIAIRPDGSVAPEPAARAGRGSASRSAAPALAAGEDPARAGAPMRTASIPTGPAVAPPPPAGTHVVQVASQKSETEAQASFRALQSKYPTVLSGRSPLIRRTDLGPRGTFYRVQVGPFASADQANELCGSLKAAGGQCIVQRN